MPATQVGYLADEHFTGEFFLTQVVSHHDVADVERVRRGAARGARSRLPGMFGVFYYRSANPKTLQTLQQFLPVPVEGLMREFAEGASRRRRLRAHDPRAARRRRAALLRVEPAARPRAADARRVMKLVEAQTTDDRSEA